MTKEDARCKATSPGDHSGKAVLHCPELEHVPADAIGPTPLAGVCLGLAGCFGHPPPHLHKKKDKSLTLYIEKDSGGDDTVLLVLDQSCCHLAEPRTSVCLMLCDFSSASNAIQLHVLAGKLLVRNIRPTIIPWVLGSKCRYLAPLSLAFPIPYLTCRVWSQWYQLTPHQRTWYQKSIFNDTKRAALQHLGLYFLPAGGTAPRWSLLSSLFHAIPMVDYKHKELEGGDSQRPESKHSNVRSVCIKLFGTIYGFL